mmetsp:Transcript_1574/g.3394  ORF Transcript_1574/g.3394 Transcript_1574/m.3394 type:complete len:273 (+) Transcript_1574:639-1457(+)
MRALSNRLHSSVARTIGTVHTWRSTRATREKSTSAALADPSMCRTSGCVQESSRRARLRRTRPVSAPRPPPSGRCPSGSTASRLPRSRRVCDRAPPTHFPSWARCQASTALTYQQATIAGASYGHPSRERQCRSSSSTARQAVSICARSTPPGSCRLSATGGVSGATNLSGSSGEPRLEQARNGVWGCCAALSSHARWVPWCCTQRTGLPDVERGRCVASRLAIVLSSRKRQSSVGNVKQTQLTIPQPIRTYTRHPARTNILYVSTTHSIPE